jgi:hypothetical protein
LFWGTESSLDRLFRREMSLLAQNELVEFYLLNSHWTAQCLQFFPVLCTIKIVPDQPVLVDYECAPEPGDYGLLGPPLWGLCVPMGYEEETAQKPNNERIA